MASRLNSNAGNTDVNIDFFVNCNNSLCSVIPIIVLDEDDTMVSVERSPKNVQHSVSQTPHRTENVIIIDSDKETDEEPVCTSTTVDSQAVRQLGESSKKQASQPGAVKISVTRRRPIGRGSRTEPFHVNTDSLFGLTPQGSGGVRLPDFMSLKSSTNDVYKNCTTARNAKDTVSAALQREEQPKRKLQQTDTLIAEPDSTSDNCHVISNSFERFNCAPQSGCDEQCARPNKKQRTEAIVANETVPKTASSSANGSQGKLVWISAIPKRKKRKKRAKANKNNGRLAKLQDIGNIIVNCTGELRKVTHTLHKADEIPHTSHYQEEHIVPKPNADGWQPKSSDSTFAVTCNSLGMPAKARNTTDPNPFTEETAGSSVCASRLENPRVPLGNSKAATTTVVAPELDEVCVLLTEAAAVGTVDNPILVSDKPNVDIPKQNSKSVTEAPSPNLITSNVPPLVRPRQPSVPCTVVRQESIPPLMQPKKPPVPCTVVRQEPIPPLVQPRQPSDPCTSSVLRCVTFPTLDILSPWKHQLSGCLVMVPYGQPSINVGIPLITSNVSLYQQQEPPRSLPASTARLMESIMPVQQAAGSLRPIAIDGSNVAYSHGKESVYSCKGIKLCIDYFVKRGHTTIKAFVPQFRRRHSAEVTDQNILEELGKKQVIVFTPSRTVCGNTISSYDDRFIVDYAAQTGAVIVSNDNFRDLMNENPIWRQVIMTRLLMYTFADDIFLIPQDPLGRRGPTLDQFLRF